MSFSRISDNSELSSLHVLLLKVALFKFQIFIALTLLSFLGPFQHVVLSQPAVCFTQGSIQSDSGPFEPAVYVQSTCLKNWSPMASTLKLLGHFTHKKCSISSLDPAEFRIFEYNPRAVILPPSTTRCTIASTWNVAGGVFTLQGQHFLEDLEFGWAWVETPAQPISDKTHSN